MLKNKILKLPEVMAITGLSRSSLYSYIKTSDFPRQVSLGKRSVGWLAEEIEAWISQRASVRGGNK